ncbi:unnamed protein product [Bursaphelenchus xylophilus]|uniref:(pine wood nematode) hypothetical protein n=1 Tax=Bursaphelenchus xylophilus TaxID=6326 RepID=A0A1I7SAX4_BURXY|nr:unnamed protein product [Bursaphelenchus xylophilus]CAG9106106.1 unnamed protein product [Bursaphelenchus xylophilus]
MSDANLLANGSTISNRNVVRNDVKVLLIGWAGCNMRYLSKYLPVYQRLGINPHLYCPQLYQGVFLRVTPSAVREYFHEIEKSVFSNPDDPTPVVFHVFSNNGSGMLAHLWKIIGAERKWWKDRVRGVIFDSGPATNDNIITWIQAAYYTNVPTTQHGTLSYLLHFALVAPVFFSYVAYLRIRTFFQPSYRQIAIPNTLLESFDDLPENQLFLYSEADMICKHQLISRFVNLQLSKQKNVETKIWPDSGHVAHLRKYPEEYSELCRHFLEKCVGRKFEVVE